MANLPRVGDPPSLQQIKDKAQFETYRYILETMRAVVLYLKQDAEERNATGGATGTPVVQSFVLIRGRDGEDGRSRG